jgi:hypothetical protein
VHYIATIYLNTVRIFVSSFKCFIFDTGTVYSVDSDPQHWLKMTTYRYSTYEYRYILNAEEIVYIRLEDALNTFLLLTCWQAGSVHNREQVLLYFLLQVFPVIESTGTQ